MGISVVEYKKALDSLQDAYDFLKQASGAREYKISRDACIQRFEFCIELAWKVSAKNLGSTSTTAKPVIREMLQNNLITSAEVWFGFIEARNKSSHTYAEEIAEEVLSFVKPFLPEGYQLLQKLQNS